MNGTMNGTAKRTRHKARITAMAVSLLLSISAVACTRPDGPNSSTPYHKDQPSESSIPAISELSAISNPKTSSNSTVPSEYTAPIYPEESETTLELVKTYPVGKAKGGIPVYLEYDSDPNHAQAYTSGVFFLAADGSLYVRDELCFINLDTGTTIDIPGCSNIFEALADPNGNFYGITRSSCIRFTAENGVEEITKIPGSGSRYELFLNQDKTVLFERDDGLYTIEGLPISMNDYSIKQISITDANPSLIQATPGLSENAKGSITLLTLFGKQYLVDSSISTRYQSEKRLLLSEYRSTYHPNGDRLAQCIYTQYDPNGNPTAKLKIASDCDVQNPIPCEIRGASAVCREYYPETVTVDSIVFERAWEYYILTDPNGELYALLLYPDKAELYRINPGYANVTLTDVSKAENSDVSTTSAITPTSTTDSSIPHVPLTREQATVRAESMIHMAWILQSEHKIVRGSAILPRHIQDANVGSSINGIPYCYGGFNGADTLGSQYTRKSFYSLVYDEISHPYMTGDVNHEGKSHRDGTIGLDCSGYVSSVYGYTSKESSRTFPNYGHTVSNFSELQKMDLLVKYDTHCYLFIRAVGSLTDPQYEIYDCTGADDIYYQSTNSRILRESRFNGYIKMRLFFDETWSSNSTQHWHGCSSCSEQKNVGNHVWRDNPSGGTYCRICNYFTGITITPTGAVLPAAITAPESKPREGNFTNPQHPLQYSIFLQVLGEEL